MGAAIVPRRLQPALAALGHECEVLYRDALGAWPRWERLRYAVSPWLAWRAAARAWRRHGPYDVIDAASAEGWLICLARRAGYFRGAAVVARSHGLEHIYYRGLVADHAAGWLHKPWWRRCWYPLTRLSQVALSLRLADRAIVLNRQEADWITAHDWKPPSRLDCIAHGVEPERWAAAPAPDARRGAGVLFSGAWYTGKGIGDLARAHQILVARGLAVPLTLLGPGVGAPLEQIEREVRASFALESQPWLTVLPRLRDPLDVDAVYRRHDLLVCPSTAEGFGMVVLEALAQRLPVVCSDAVGVAERLCHGVNAWIVPARDSHALAEALVHLWQDPRLRQNLAERGHDWARAFTWRHAAEHTVDCYAAALRFRNGV